MVLKPKTVSEMVSFVIFLFRKRKKALSFVFLIFLFALFFGGCNSLFYQPRNYEDILWEKESIQDKSKQKEVANITVKLSPHIEKYISKVLEKNELTLMDLYALALAYNEKLKIAGEDYFQAITTKAQALSLILPTINLKSQYFRQEGISVSGLPRSFATNERTELWLTFSQPLFRGLSDIYTLKAANINIKSKEYQLLHQRMQIFWLVADVFYKILKVQRQIEIVKNFVEIRAKRLEEMKQRQKLGIIRETEVLLVETQLAADKAQLEELQNTLQILQANLQTIVGIPVLKPVKESFQEPKTFPSIEEFINKAFVYRKDLEAKRLDIEAIEAKIKSVKGEYLPLITWSANAYIRREGYLKDVDWDTTITVDVPLFSGFHTKAKLDEHLSMYRQLVHSYEQLKKEIEEQIKTIYFSIKTSEALIEKFQKEVESAQANYQLLYEEYKQKIATNLELLFADVNLQSAKVKLEIEKLNLKEYALKLNIITGEEIWDISKNTEEKR